LLNAVELSKEMKLAQMNRLLDSHALHNAENLRSFLRFVITKTLDHQESQLKEYTIATEVFGRPSKYDPRNDSVVRVQASRLRSKLQEYYATEGKDDPVIIQLPKGSYIPTFSLLPEASEISITPEKQTSMDSFPPATSALEPADHAASITDLTAPPMIAATVSNPPFLPQSNVSRYALYVLTIASVIAAASAIYLYASKPNEAKLSAGTMPPEIRAAMPLWQDFLHSPQPVLVSFSNTMFEGTAESGMKLLKPMDSTLANEEVQNSDTRRKVITEHYTGTGEVMGVYALTDFFAKANHAFRVKRSLLLTWDDLRAGNIVILGSPAENLLIRDLPQQQDFLFKVMKDENGKESLAVVNTKPQAGEQPVYFARQQGPSRSQISEDYAVISLLRGLEAKDRLMILAGITTFGTQAAAEYVTKPEYIEDLLKHLALSSGANAAKLPAYFQALIKVKVNGGVPIQISYVTHHIL